MAITFDGPNRLAILGSGTVSIDAREIWSRWVDWVSLFDNAKFLPMFRQLGGDTVDAAAGTSVPIYLFMLNGWKVRPQEASHTLAVSGAILLVDGGGDPFANTTGIFNVRINYQQPVQAITVSTGGGGGSGGLTPTQALMLDELHKIMGLDPASPMTVTPTGRVAGQLNQIFTGDGETTTTVTRQ
jgi:hypothetical protein